VSAAARARSGPRRRAPALAALALAGVVAVAGCSPAGGGGSRRTGAPVAIGGGGARPATTAPGAGGAGAQSDRVAVRRGAFPPSEGSGVVGSASHPGVLWAIRDGGRSEPGRPRVALYAYKLDGGRLAELAPGRRVRAVPVPGAANVDWEDIARDDRGNLWIGDIGDNDCDRSSITLYKVREPDPATATSATLLAGYRLRYPDHDPGCRGWDAESLFLADGVPYLITKSSFPAVYQATALDPARTTTMRRLGGLGSGGTEPLLFPTGADLSSDHRRLAVVSYPTLAVYETGDPSKRGEALVADLTGHAARWTLRLGCLLCPVDQLSMIEGVAFTGGGNDLTLLSERHDVWVVPRRAYER
jgi:hypothetical protein